MIAPLRDRIWTREEEIAYALERGIPIKATKDSPYSIDENLFGRSIEAGILEDPWAAPPEDAYLADRRSRTSAPAPAELVIGFEAGLPISLDGEELALAELIARAERARRRVRHRPDRHDREPRRRHQEPRGLRGSCGPRPDRGPPRPRGSRPDEGESCRPSASSRRAGPSSSTTGSGSARSATRSTRSSTRRRSS